MPTSLIRASAFLRKEIFEIVRQPKLLLTLVAGPFIIMLLFGIGYSNNAVPLRILFVAEKGSAIEAKIAELAPNVTQSLLYEGISNDEAAALLRLRRGEVDLVAIGRELLHNPNWVLDAADKLGEDDLFTSIPPNYGYWLEKRATSGFKRKTSTWLSGIDQDL